MFDTIESTQQQKVILKSKNTKNKFAFAQQVYAYQQACLQPSLNFPLLKEFQLSWRPFKPIKSTSIKIFESIVTRPVPDVLQLITSYFSEIVSFTSKLLNLKKVY